MSQDGERSIGEYRTELNESVDDGGGCTEAWEALSAERSSSRRGFLAAAVGTMLIGSSTATAERSPDVELDSNKTISELSEQEKSRLIKKALGSDELESARGQLRSHGLKPDLKNASAYRSTYEDEEWRFVRVPFTSGESSRTALDSTPPQYRGAVVWNTLDKIEPYGYLTTKEVARDSEVSSEVERALEASGADMSSVDTVPVKITNTVMRPRKRDETSSLVFPVAREQDGVSAQNSADCACTALLGSPLTACAPCGTPDIDCISDLVNNFALEIVACGSCAVSSGWLTTACATCVATIIEEDNYDAFCCWCDAIDL